MSGIVIDLHSCSSYITTLLLFFPLLEDPREQLSHPIFHSAADTPTMTLASGWYATETIILQVFPFFSGVCNESQDVG